jgi:hypothetical protein
MAYPYWAGKAYVTRQAGRLIQTGYHCKEAKAWWVGLADPLLRNHFKKREMKKSMRKRKRASNRKPKKEKS